MKTVVWALGLLAVLTVLPACPRTSSCNVTTEGVYCTFRVVEEDGVVKAVAIFSVGDALGTALVLGAECGDAITVNGAPLQERQGLFVFYEATVEPADAYTFVFTRGEDEYSSTVGLPAAFTIDAPAEGQVVSRREAMAVVWPPLADEGDAWITVAMEGPCVPLFADRALDTGAYIVNAGKLLPEGALDPALQGAISGRSVQHTFIHSVE
jgi:hypothetical protein